MTRRFTARGDAGLALVLAKAGSLSNLARALNISASTVSMWKKVPETRVGQVCRLLGLKSTQVRPDLIGRVDLRLAPPVPGTTDIAARKIARGHLAAVAAELVVAGCLHVDRTIVARTRSRARRLAIYVAATAVDEVCRTTIARHFAVSHQLASKTMREVTDQREKDDALDLQLDELCALTAMAFGKGAV